jgi:hypothetical protein
MSSNNDGFMNYINKYMDKGDIIMLYNQNNIKFQKLYIMISHSHYL